MLRDDTLAAAQTRCRCHSVRTHGKASLDFLVAWRMPSIQLLKQVNSTLRRADTTRGLLRASTGSVLPGTSSHDQHSARVMPRSTLGIASSISASDTWPSILTLAFSSVW